MTVIAWDGVNLAADKQASEGNTRHVTTKIKRIQKGEFKGYLVGGAGSTSQSNQMIVWFESGADPNFFPRYQDDETVAAQLLAISPDKIIYRFDFNPIPCVLEDGVYAIGSGRDVALGAIAMGATAQQAVEIASSICEGCGMGVDVLPLKPRKTRKK